MQAENERQDAALKAKLLAQRRRRKDALTKASDAIEDKQGLIAKLEGEKAILEQEKEDVLENGMSDPQLIAINEKEKAEIRTKMDKDRREKEDIIRKEYMNRLKNAKNDKEKERILEEMNRRLKAMEEENERERLEQERNLEKILLARQMKRVKKLAHDH